MRPIPLSALIVAMVLAVTSLTAPPSVAQDEPPVLVYVTWDGTPPAS